LLRIFQDEHLLLDYPYILFLNHAKMYYASNMIQTFEEHLFDHLTIVFASYVLLSK